MPRPAHGEGVVVVGKVQKVMRSKGARACVAGRCAPTEHAAGGYVVVAAKSGVRPPYHTRPSSSFFHNKCFRSSAHKKQVSCKEKACAMSRLPALFSKMPKKAKANACFTPSPVHQADNGKWGGYIGERKMEGG